MESNFYKNYKGDRKEILRFAEKAVNDFEIYKAKNITAHEEWEKPPLETFYVAYQLMVSMLKFHLKKITIDELDFQLMKEQLLLLFNCEYNKDFLSCIIETLTIDFMGNLLMLFYLKTARVFFNLSIHMTGLCQKRRENLTNQQSPPNEDNKLYEIKYFEPFLHVSCQMMLRDSCWTEEKEAKEAIFEDLLEKLEIDDKYEGIPEMIQTFKQVIAILN